MRTATSPHRLRDVKLPVLSGVARIAADRGGSSAPDTHIRCERRRRKLRFRGAVSGRTANSSGPAINEDPYRSRNLQSHPVSGLQSQRPGPNRVSPRDFGTSLLPKILDELLSPELFAVLRPPFPPSPYAARPTI